MSTNESNIPGVAAEDSRITRASVSVADSVLPDAQRAHQQKLAQAGYGIPDGFYAMHPDLPGDKESAETVSGDGGTAASDIAQDSSPHNAGMPPAISAKELAERTRARDAARASREEVTRSTPAGVVREPRGTGEKGSDTTRDGVDFASDEAAEAYVAAGLAPSDLPGTPSGKGGYTKADVEAAIRDKEGR